MAKYTVTYNLYQDETNIFEGSRTKIIEADRFMHASDIAHRDVQYGHPFMYETVYSIIEIIEKSNAKIY